MIEWSLVLWVIIAVICLIMVCRDWWKEERIRYNLIKSKEPPCGCSWLRTCTPCGEAMAKKDRESKKEV
jgi:hypothetical protein